MPKSEASTASLLRDVYAKKDAHAATVLAQAFFGYALTPGQADIAATVAWGEHRRVAITAHTRYGKTFATGVGVALGIITHDPKERPLKWMLLGPTADQASLVYREFSKCVTRCPLLQELIPDQKKSHGRLDDEVSKERITFIDGQELELRTADGKAKGLMGHGADRLIVDEAALIKRETYDDRVYRMLGDNPDRAVLILLSNPWDEATPFGDAWNSALFRNIHVHYEQGLAEGRITEAWLEEQRGRLPPAKFQVLYESRFPDMADDQLIPSSWIDRAIVKEFKAKGGLKGAGVDFAEGGGDKTVVTRGRHWEIVVDGKRKPFCVAEEWHAWQVADTNQTAERIWRLLDPGEALNGDANGLGKGPMDRIAALDKEHGTGRAQRQCKGGRKASRPKDYVNFKAEMWWNVRELFEAGRVRLVNPPPEVKQDLRRMRWDLASGKTRVFEQDGKTSGNSPDHGDSLAHFLWRLPRPAAPVPVGRPAGL